LVGHYIHTVYICVSSYSQANFFLLVI
jgi:hypothetical protein